MLAADVKLSSALQLLGAYMHHDTPSLTADEYVEKLVEQMQADYTASSTAVNLGDATVVDALITATFTLASAEASSEASSEGSAAPTGARTAVITAVTAVAAAADTAAALRASDPVRGVATLVRLAGTVQQTLVPAISEAANDDEITAGLAAFVGGLDTLQKVRFPALP